MFREGSLIHPSKMDLEDSLVGGGTSGRVDMAALSGEFSDLVQIKKQLLSVMSLCKERGLVHSVKWYGTIIINIIIIIIILCS